MCLLLWFFQISKQHLQTVKERFQAFLNGDTQIVADEAFINAVQSYYDVSLCSLSESANCFHNVDIKCLLIVCVCVSQ